MKITFIGGGNMAKALIGGLIKRGYSPSKMHVVEMFKEKCADLHSEFGVRATTELAEAVAHGETLIIAVKPQQLQEVAVQLAPIMEGQLVISIAAGIRTQDLARWIGTQNIVRCMPNTPALIRCGVTALYAMPAVKTGTVSSRRVSSGGSGQYLVDRKRRDVGCSDGDLRQRSGLCVLFHRSHAAGGF